MSTEATTAKRTKDEVLRAIAGFNIDPFDTIQLGYNASNQVKDVYYKQGGTTGKLVCYLSLSYVAAGNGTGEVATVTAYSTSTSTTTSTT